MDILTKIGVAESLAWLLFCSIIAIWIVIFGGSVKVTLNTPWGKKDDGKES